VKNTPIVTRLHKLAELVQGDDLPATEHHYVIADDLLAALPRADVQNSIAAMIEADMARLPFPELLVEFSVEPGVTRFLWLREAPGGFEATTAMLSAKGLATVPKRPALVTLQGSALCVRDHADERDGRAIILGTAFALLMLNIAGVEKQRIEPSRLNKAREKRGDAPIPAHVVLRIGVVYGRDGRLITSAHALKKVYLRAGHVRQQACGKGWSEHKPVYIAPQLVNFTDGADAPAPKIRVTKMGGLTQ